MTALQPRWGAEKADRPRRADELPQLTRGCSSPADLVGRWHLLHTQANQERRVAGRLDAAGVGYFLPLAELIERDARGNRVCKTRPLFGGYVFACVADDAQFYDLSKCKSQIVHVADSAQAQLVRELCEVYLATAGGYTIDRAPFATPGRECEVTDGPFKGKRGSVEFRDGRGRITLRVEILGQSISIELDPDILEPV